MTELKGLRADFHVHYSDQSAIPTIEEAREKGIGVVGFVRRLELSDRLPEFVEYGRERGVKVLPGLEYTALIDRDSDIVADLIILDIDPKHPDLLYYFGENNPHSVRINQEVAKGQLAFLQNQGFVVEILTDEDRNLYEEAMGGHRGEKAIKLCNLVINNEKNRDKVNRLIANNLQEFDEVNRLHGAKPYYMANPHKLDAKFLYEHYFAPGKPGYQRVSSHAETIIDIAHRAGGVVLYSPEGKFNLDTWNKLIDWGVDGIMLWHGSRMELPPNIPNREFIKSVRERGLLVLGGSDYDPEKNHWQIGYGKGDMYTSIRRANELEEYQKKRKLI